MTYEELLEDKNMELGNRIATLERELVEARAYSEQLLARIKRGNALTQAAEARLAAVATIIRAEMMSGLFKSRLLAALSAPAEPSNGPDDVWYMSGDVLIEDADTRLVVNRCDTPAEPQCPHEGIGLPGCPTCDPRTKAEGGPR